MPQRYGNLETPPVPLTCGPRRPRPLVTDSPKAPPLGSLAVDLQATPLGWHWPRLALTRPARYVRSSEAFAPPTRPRLCNPRRARAGPRPLTNGSLHGRPQPPIARLVGGAGARGSQGGGTGSSSARGCPRDSRPRSREVLRGGRTPESSHCPALLPLPSARSPRNVTFRVFLDAR